MKDISIILSEIVTLQENAWSRELKKISLGDTLNFIKDEKLDKDITILRSYLSVGNKKQYDSNKKRLPAVTFSGEYSTSRKQECLSSYNRLCVIDIDHLSNVEIQRLYKEFISEEYLISFWRSPSGSGIKGIIRFDFKKDFELNNSIQYHKIGFIALKEYFKNNHSVSLDESGSDITRLCFLTSDRDIVIQRTFKEFHIDNSDIEKYNVSEHRENKKVRKKTRFNVITSFNQSKYMNPKGKNKSSNRYMIQKIIKHLKKRNLSITETYDKWYRIGYAIANSFTYDLGLKYYLSLCKLDGIKYDEKSSIEMLQYCYENSKESISFGTILFFFTLRGNLGEQF